MTTPLHLAGLTYAALPNGYGPPLAAPRLIVVHDTGNTATAEQEAHYAATRTDDRSKWTSAHAYVDTSGALGSVPLTQRAWAAPPDNGDAWQVELCGTDGALNAVTVARAAAVVAHLAVLGSIPITHLTGDALRTGRGITGHRDINAVFHQSDHTDPGPAFDWGAFIAAVGAAAHLPPTVRKGSTGVAVTRAQRALDLRGYGLAVDGDFGPATDAAVRRYQQSVGITVDGVVGPVTWSHLLYV